MKKKITTAGLVVASLAILMLLLARRYSTSYPAEAQRGVLLLFHGLTNVQGKNIYALFSVTNAGSQRTSFSPDGLEYRTSLAWITNSLRNKRRDDWLYWYQDASQNVRLGNWYDFDGYLEPGATATFAAPILSTNTPWRLQFYCVEQATGLHGLTERTGDLIEHTTSVITKGAARNQTTFSGRRYYLFSPELSQ